MPMEENHVADAVHAFIPSPVSPRPMSFGRVKKELRPWSREIGLHAAAAMPSGSIAIVNSAPGQRRHRTRTAEASQPAAGVHAAAGNSPGVLRPAPVVGMIDLSVAEDSLPTALPPQKFWRRRFDAGPRAATARQEESSTRTRPPKTANMPGRWKGSIGRLLTFDERGPHNRAHFRRDSFPAPRTVQQQERMRTAESGESSVRSRQARVISTPCVEDSGARRNDTTGFIRASTPEDSVRESSTSPASRPEGPASSLRAVAGGYAKPRTMSNPLPRLPLKSEMHSWEDPFIPGRRAQLERSRQLRSQTVKETFFSSQERRGLLTARERNSRSDHKDVRVPKSARHSSETQTRKSSQSSRVLTVVKPQHVAQDSLASEINLLTNMVERADRQARYALDKKQQASVRGLREVPHMFYEVPWHVPSYHDHHHHRQVKGENFTQYLGQQFEHHLTHDIIGAEMAKVRWGDRKASKEECGLQELDEGLTRGKERNAEFLQKMIEVRSFVEDMQIPKNKQTLLEGRAIAQATMGEAQEFLDDLEGLCPEQETKLEVMQMFDPEFDVRNISYDNLDRILKNLVLMNDRGAMFDAERKSRIPPQPSLQNGDADLEDNIERDGRRFMRANELIGHAALHRDLAYCRFKTAEFQRDVEGKYVKDPDLVMHRSQAQQGFHIDKSLHYLRFTILKAAYLPIMDETKRTNDAYVRCTLHYDGKISAGTGDKEQTVCTKVAWDTKRPVWNQEYTFSIPYHPSARVCLLLEVMDAASVEINANPMDEWGDEDKTATAPSDIILGQVEFIIMSGGMQVMSPEHEYSDSYFLCESDGSKVRDNFGVVDAVLKGRSSTLDIRHVYTRRPRLSMDDFVVLLQSNIRCLLARRARANERRLRHLRQKRSEQLDEFTVNSEEKMTWAQYVQKCLELGTHPVASLKRQITSGGIILARYSLKSSAVLAISAMACQMLSARKLTTVSLCHVDLSSDAIQVLADGLCSVDDCPLVMLILDGNPLSKEPTDHSQDPLRAKQNRNSFSLAGAEAIARTVDRLKRLTTLSVAGCKLGSGGVEIVAESVRLHRKMMRFNISDNVVSSSSGTDFLGACNAMGALLIGNDTLLELSYDNNNLNRKCGQSFFGGTGFPDHGLLYNFTLRTLKVASTGCCRTGEGVESLSKVLSASKCSLELLDISSCGLTGKHMHILKQGLNASKLSMLVLDGNPIQTRGNGYEVLMDRRGRKKYIIGRDEKAEVEDKFRNATVRLSAAEVQIYFDTHSRMGTVRLTDKRQMKRLFEDLGFEWDLNQVMSVAHDIDLDNDDSIDFYEFFKWYQDKMKVTEDGEAILEISIRNCGIKPKDAHFNADFPGGSYDLDMHFLRSRNILRTLMRLQYCGMGKILSDSVKRVCIDATGEEEEVAFDLQVGDDVSRWSIPHNGWICFEFESKHNGLLLYGEKSLSNQEMTALEEAFKAPGATLETRNTSLQANLSRKTSLLYRQAAQILSWFPIRRSRTTRAMHEPHAHGSQGKQFTLPQEEGLGRSEIFGFGEIDGIRSSRAVHVRHLERTEDSELVRAMASLDWERIEFVIRVMPMLNARRRDLRILNNLEDRERRTLCHRLCIVSRNTIYHNPAGYYRFDLSRLAERDCCIKLISLTANDINQASADFRDFGSRHKGGARDKVELVWKNARLDGRIMKLERDLNVKDYCVPYDGILDVDFVDIRKPDSRQGPMPAAAFKTFLTHLQQPRLTASGRIEEIVELSSMHYFTCLQVILLQQLFTGEDSGWRAELCVALFARTIDWRAYHYVLRYAGPQACHIATHRIGRLNVFFDGASCAVGYWRLDLTLNDERYIMQELLQLATDEQGQNLVDCEYNGVPFDIPASWAETEVPRTGEISLFYVRTQQVNSRILAGGLPAGRFVRGLAPQPQQYPPNFIVPSVPVDFCPGDSVDIPWIVMEKVRLIKEALQKVMGSAHEVFKMLDVDGSNTIERDEFSRGLFRVGVLLKPSEMRMMLDLIDVDKSNEISIQEFVELWEQAPPLRLRDETQAMFWCAA